MLRSIHARLNVVLIWLCLLIMVCLCAPRTTSAQSADNDVALNKLVEKFFDLYQKKDLEGLMALWSEKSPDFLDRRQEFQQTFAANKIQLKSLTIRAIDVDESNATIRAALDIAAEDIKTGKAADGFGVINRTIHLSMEGNTWKVWQYVASERELAANLISAKTNEERKGILAAEKELITVELVRELLSQGRQLMIRNGHATAIDFFELALNLAEQLHDAVGTSSALRSIGYAQSSQGNYTLALADFQKSLKISQQIDDKQGIAYSLNGIGVVHYSQGNYAQALERYGESLRISREISDKRGIIATIGAMGMIHNSQGNYALALASHRESLKLSQEINHTPGITAALNNIGAVHDSQGNYAQALEHYRESLKISQEMGHNLMIAATLTAIGMVHDSQGNYTQSLEHFQKGLKIIQQIGYRQGIAALLNNIGAVHYLQSNYTLALEYFQKSLKISYEVNDKLGIGNTLVTIGLIHKSQGNYTLALEHFHAGLKIIEEMNYKSKVSNTLNSIGVVHYLQNNYTQALEYFQKSLKITEETGDRLGIANTLNNIGDAHNWQGHYAQALEHYQKSLKIRKELGDKRGIAATLQSIGMVHNSQGNHALALTDFQASLKISQQIGYKDGIADTLTSIGTVYYAQGNYSSAREELTSAIATIEELRGKIAGDEQQQQQFFQTKLSPYRQMIRLLISEKKPVEALGYAERVKGRALLDTLETGRVEITKAMTKDEQAEEQKLNAEVVSLNTQIYRENLRKQPDKSVLIDLQAQREKARARYEAIQINLYAAHPELKIHRGKMKPVTLEEADKLIPGDGTAIVQYVVTEENTYMFVLTKAKQSPVNLESSTNVPILNVYTINIKQKDLADRVNRFHSRLSQKDIDFSRLSRDLYDLLIGPAQDDLKNKVNLIVVPDDVLWQVPFQALQPSVNRFLIQDYAISYAPSLTVLYAMMNVKQKRQHDSSTQSTLIAFGNPDVYPTAAANLQPSYSEARADDRLLPLPQTEAMVKTLSHLYGPDRSRIYVGTEAREDRAKKEAGTCRILQFATHGILDNINPMYSRLVMSQSGIGEHQDGMLEAWEVMKLNLKAEMAILSACDTAQGRVAGGEGMIGLAWAFFVAGCPTMVVSQWLVEVNSTTELMVEFHKGLKPGFEGRSSDLSKAEALRASMLKIMKNPRYRHPFYWAPFVVIGDAR